MATLSTDITVRWGNTYFGEVTDLQWSYGGSGAKDRLGNSAGRWTDEVGSVSVSCLGTANITTVNYGKLDDLTITGGGSALTHKALYESLNVAPELNGVTRYTVTFKLLDG